MAALPYIQLYVADYLADTAHLTAAQHGAYLLLIMNYWQRGQSLNNSNERLTNVARMSNEEWAENKSVLQEFFVIDGDNWIHSRIERDLEAVRAKSTKASNAGKTSAQRKADKRSTDVQRTFNHTDTDTDTDTDTETTTPQTPVTGGAKPKLAIVAQPFSVPAGVDPDAWRDFDTHRIALGKKTWTDQAKAKTAQLLARHSAEQQRQMVDEAIRSGWRGVFEPKTQQAQKFVQHHSLPSHKEFPR